MIFVSLINEKMKKERGCHSTALLVDHGDDPAILAAGGSPISS
jgi:hypothetical protein